jgi:glycosyltransferase involved in cell wall biosynthesis
MAIGKSQPSDRAAARPGPNDQAPSATVAIVTKNRKEELAQAIESAVKQDVSCEVIVVDDGSTDGTSEFVSQHYPSVRLMSFPESAGYIVRRNQAAQMARAPIVFSIDDDAIFTTPRAVRQTLGEFDNPRIGAVAIPFIDVRISPELRQAAPDERQTYVSFNFTGTAYAVRRELFLKLGGYREILVHMCEESDFCQRMLQAGYVTRLGRADPIHHTASPKRDLTRMDVFGRRNDVLFAWYNVPLRYLPIHMTATVFNGLRHGVRTRRLMNMVRGFLYGFATGWKSRGDRRPVSAPVYRLGRTLKKGGSKPLAEIEQQLPQRLDP